MATMTFDTLKTARRLKAAGFTEEQAEAQVEAMAQAFDAKLDDLVTKGHLDSQLAVINGKLRLVFWAQGLTIAVIVLPQLRTFFTA